MKTRWLSLVSLALAGGALGAHVSGCADDDASGGFTDDAASPDSGPEAAPLFDAGLDAPISDSSIVCGPTDFCPTALTGTPTLNGIFAVSTTRAVGITKEGKILLWDGAVWKTIAQGYGSLTSIWAIDADHFLIAEDKSWSLIELTFSGAVVSVAQESLPYDSACVPSGIAVSGQSATDLYATAYCRVIDDSTFTVGYKGILFRARSGEAGTGRAWSVIWSAGGPNLEAVALGAVYEVSPGVALAGGWRSREEMYPDPLMYKTPNAYGDATQPGTTTFLLTARGSVVTKQDLGSTLGMCVQSIWASPTMESVFIGGVCTGVDTGDISDSKTKYTTIAHRAGITDAGADGGADGGAPGWTAVVREAYATYFDQPAILLGFGTVDVYAAGSYLTHWDGTAFTLVPTAVSGSPLGSRVTGLQGISSNDLWMVGDRFALHRAQ